jgi:hypothetical protein
VNKNGHNFEIIEDFTTKPPHAMLYNPIITNNSKYTYIRMEEGEIN